MKLGVVFGYWGASPRPGVIELAQDAERLGYDSVWVAESWGNDAFTFGAWVAAHTDTIKIGTGVVQIAARTPTATAMAAVTLDHLSNGRLILGLGVSGPQVVEGWYGQPSNRPLARTREYIEVIRRALRRDGPLEFDGEFYPLPYRGPGSVGLGKPLKIMTHPLRADIPIYLGAEGPKNVRLAVELCDGWIPLYYSPYRPEVYDAQLAGATDGFEIAVNVTVTVAHDLAVALLPVKGALGFYIGGMGARSRNFHMELMARMGFEEEAHRIQDLFFAGKREEAVMAVPDAFADEISLVGPPERIRDRLEEWRKTPVTTLLVGNRDPETMRLMADLTR